MFNHALMKGALFLVLGCIFYRIGSCHIDRMAGIARRMPWTMAAFVGGGLSLIGIPLTAGFISKWYLLTGSLDSTQQWAFGIFLSSSLLNAAYFLPIVYKAFFAKPSDPARLEKAKEPPLMTVVPLFITAAGCLLLFFLSDNLFQLASNFAELYASNE